MVAFPFNAGWRDTTFRMVGNSVSAGFGLSGASISVSSNSGHWMGEASFVIHTEDQYFAWQGFIAGMRGVLGTTLVPCRSRYLPFDAQGRRMNGADAVNIGKTSFWEATGIGQSPLIHAELAAAAALRDGAIDVRYIDTLGLRPGHFISLGENLHRVVNAFEASEGVHRVVIEPVLRSAFPAGERVVLDRPHCRMRFVSAEQGAIEQAYQRAHTMTIQMIEDVQ